MAAFVLRRNFISSCKFLPVSLFENAATVTFCLRTSFDIFFFNLHIKYKIRIQVLFAVPDMKASQTLEMLFTNKTPPIQVLFPECSQTTFSCELLT